MVATKFKLGLVAITILAINIFLYRSCTMQFSIPVLGPGAKEVIPEWKREACVARDSIVFRKTHKCASGTVQNILLRYGLNHHLDFVLPNQENFLGKPELMGAQVISRKLDHFGPYHILTHHTRSDILNIKKVMKNNASIVTILQDPVSLYKSLYAYYDLEKQYNQTLSEFIKRPDSELYAQERYASRIGFNQMSWDLGLEPKHFRRQFDIFNFIRAIEQEFDLVMIAEYLEASLVLLSDLMCWPLEEVAFIPLGIHYFSKGITLQRPEIERISDLNMADDALYSYFLRRFKASIRQFGVELMVDKVIELIDLNLNLYRRCIMDATVQRKGKATYAYTNYVLNAEAENYSFCKYATMKETEFTEELRYIQRIRLQTLNNLQRLLE